MRGSNVYLKYVREFISNEADYDAIFAGVVQLLRDKLTANNTYLPHSQRDFSFHHEILVFLYLLVESNEGFRTHIGAKKDVGALRPASVVSFPCCIRLAHVG